MRLALPLVVVATSLVATSLVACQSSSSSSGAPAVNETVAPPTPSVAVSAPSTAPAQPASPPVDAAAAATASAAVTKAMVATAHDGKPTSIVACHAKAGASQARSEFDMSKTPMIGTVTIDGPVVTAHRSFKIHATPSEGTYVFLFDGYGDGDVKPAAEKLTPKSIVARQVTVGKFDKLFFDGDVKLVPKSGKAPDFVCGE